VAGFLIGEALRDLRRAGRVAVSAIVLITLSLAALGGFWLLSSNLARAVANWRERVRIIVYLKREPAASEAPALVERVQGVPGVASVVYLSKADALKSLKEILGKDASVVAQLPANPLPASLEVTPAAAAATPDRHMRRNCERVKEIFSMALPVGSPCECGGSPSCVCS